MLSRPVEPPAREQRAATGSVCFDGFSWFPMGEKTPTLRDVSIRIEPGERVIVAGPSGSGKSTLLQAISGGLGETIPGQATGRIDVCGRTGFGLQNPAEAIVAEKVGRDIAFGPENLGYSREEIHRRIQEMIDAVGLPAEAERSTVALSGGQQQRLALAGVLAMRPDVVLLDEPTSMLDHQTAAHVRETILAAAGGRTLVIAEHRIEPWLQHVDRVLVLDAHGHVAADAHPENLMGEPAATDLWLPQRAAPEPLTVPDHLVAPDHSAEAVEMTDISVDLVTRSLRDSITVPALRELSATAEPQNVTVFAGPSGAGKSTALQILAGLLRPDAGTVSPDRRRLRSRQLAAELGWVPQNPEHGFLATSVEDEIALTSHRLDRRVDVGTLAGLFGLDHRMHVNPFRLSSGEQRRLALIAALAHRPGTVVLDEPTVGQDRATWAAVTGWMHAAARVGCVVAVASHDPLLPADTTHMLEAPEGP